MDKQKTIITLIAAAGENNALGKDNALPWHLPNDFKRFKKLTTGHTIVMGRKTFESFPRPLPNRRHIVITRCREYTVPYKDCTVVHSLEEAFNQIEGEEGFIIGGGEIYAQAMPFADKIELTRVHGHFEADTYFPLIDDRTWQLVHEARHPKDERHAHAFTYLTYVRRETQLQSD